MSRGLEIDDPIEQALRCLTDDPRTVPPAIRTLARRLLGVNAALWSLEDDARGAVDDARLGQVKRAIDRYNLLRSELISDIDRVVGAAQPPAVRDLAPLSCSVGTTVDRLTVAVQRVRTFEAARDTRTSDARCQLDDLRAATVVDWTDLRQGRRRLPHSGVLKRYAPG